MMGRISVEGCHGARGGRSTTATADGGQHNPLDVVARAVGDRVAGQSGQRLENEMEPRAVGRPERSRLGCGWRRPILTVKATGRGANCRRRADRYGFPRGYLTRQKRVRDRGLGYSIGSRRQKSWDTRWARGGSRYRTFQRAD